MIKLVRTISDKLVESLVPTSKAGACIDGAGYQYTKTCYCLGGRIYRKNCTVLCDGSSSCGSCYGTPLAC